MRKIERKDILDILEYEKTRVRLQARVREIKLDRRLAVGRYLTFIFENRDTVIFQIQEMMRVERTVREERIADEIEVYNSMIPDAGELSATLMIEIIEERQIKPVLDRFLGIDNGQTAWLQFGVERVFAVFEGGRSDETNISAVHFLRFPFSESQVRRFRSREDEAWLHVRHGTYRAKALLADGPRSALIQDLAT